MSLVRRFPPSCRQVVSALSHPLPPPKTSEGFPGSIAFPAGNKKKSIVTYVFADAALVDRMKGCSRFCSRQTCPGSGCPPTSLGTTSWDYPSCINRAVAFHRYPPPPLLPRQSMAATAFFKCSSSISGVPTSGGALTAGLVGAWVHVDVKSLALSAVAHWPLRF